jgi:hypothetical protein
MAQHAPVPSALDRGLVLFIIHFHYFSNLVSCFVAKLVEVGAHSRQTTEIWLKIQKEVAMEPTIPNKIVMGMVGDDLFRSDVRYFSSTMTWKAQLTKCMESGADILLVRKVRYFAIFISKLTDLTTKVSGDERSKCSSGLTK